MGFNSGFKGLKVKKISGISWPLKMGPIGCPETSVRNYHSALRDVQEESRFMLNGLCCLSPRDTCFLANYAVSDCGLECEGLCHVFTCMRTTALLYLRVCVPQPYCMYEYIMALHYREFQLHRLDRAGQGYGQVAGTLKRSNESSVPIKCRGIFD